MSSDEPVALAAELRVLVVADRQLVGEAVRTALGSRGFQVANVSLPTASSERRGLLRRVAKYRPQVGVLICELDGPEVLQQAANFLGRTPMSWLLLTGSSDPREWGGLLELGVQGVLSMSAGIDDVTTALRRLEQGLPLMTDSARSKLIDTWREYDERRQRLGEQLARLTPREFAVLEELAQGRTVRAIADAHGVSEATVRSQVRSIRRKLEVSSQLAAVAIYRAMGSPTAEEHHPPRRRRRRS